MYPKSLSINRPEVPIEEACVDMANLLIIACKLRMPKMISIDNIASHFFTSVYEQLFGLDLKDPFTSEYKALTSQKESYLIQRMIDKIADFMKIDLSHISGSDIVARNPFALYYLLEILLSYYEITKAMAKPHKKLTLLFQTDSLSTTPKEIMNLPLSQDLSTSVDKPEKSTGEEDGDDHLKQDKSSSPNFFDQCSIFLEKLTLKESDSSILEDSNLNPWSSDNSNYWQKRKPENPNVHGNKDNGISFSSSQTLHSKLTQMEPKKVGAEHAHFFQKKNPDGACPLPLCFHNPSQDNDASSNLQNDSPPVQFTWNAKPMQETNEALQGQYLSNYPIIREKIIFKRPKNEANDFKEGKRQCIRLRKRIRYQGNEEMAAYDCVQNKHSQRNKTDHLQHSSSRCSRCQDKYLPLTTSSSPTMTCHSASPPLTTSPHPNTTKLSRSCFFPRHNQRHCSKPSSCCDICSLCLSLSTSNLNKGHLKKVSSNAMNEVKKCLEDNFTTRVSLAMDETFHLAALAKKSDNAYKKICCKKKIAEKRKAYTYSCRKSVLLPKARRIRKISPQSSKELDLFKEGCKNLLGEIQDCFPYIDLSQETLNFLHRKAQQELSWAANQLAKLVNDTPLVKVKCKEALEKQKKLSEIFYKDMCTHLRLRNLREEEHIKQSTKGALTDMRINKARCCRYIEHYHKWFLRRLQGQRQIGEAFVKNVFLDRCQSEKARVLELQKRFKQLQQAEAKALSQRLIAMCTYYESQCEALLEKLSKEATSYRIQAKEQTLAIEKIKHEFRRKLERAVQELQDNIVRADTQQWRELDADHYCLKFR